MAVKSNVRRARNSSSKKKAKTVQRVTAPPIQPEGLEQCDFKTLLEELRTKSAVIRYLTSEGLSRSDIVKVTGIRYQHVRNVQLMPVGQKVEEPTH